jgi:uncharacterized DUF497 family protein
LEFEFDPAKSVANEAKHGIDFVAAKAVRRSRDEEIALYEG